MEEYDIKNGCLQKYHGNGSVAVIPEGVTSIGDEAFYGCHGLKSVVIPEGVTSIGRSVFCNCRGLESIVIPKGVTSIGYSAFVGCIGLESIVIPESVTSIGDWAFHGCHGLESIVIPEGVTSIGSGVFCACRGLESIVIPEGVTSIGDEAFNGCHGLKSVVIHEGVTSIGRSVFCNCRGLESIVIPKGVTSIGYKAFYGCHGLESIVIPEGVTSIGDRAFVGCIGLKSIVIPESVTSIGDGAFYGCHGLESIVIPEGVTSIEDEAFRGCHGLKSVVIHEGVTSIGSGVFCECRGLESIVIPKGVTSIGDSAFSCCHGLESIVIPEGVTSIGDRAFDGCIGLKSIVIPESVTSIGDEAFDRCCELEKLGPLSSSCKMGKRVFGFLFPEGLINSIGDFYKCLADRDIKEYILDKRVWAELDKEVKAEIFIMKQGKSLITLYESLIRKEEAKFIGETLLKKLSEKSGAKECNAAANFMLLFSRVTSSELLYELYERMKSIKTARKALETIEADVSLMKKLDKDISVDQLLPEIEKKIKVAMIENGKGSLMFEQTLKSFYNLELSALPKLRDLNGLDVAPIVFAYLLTCHEEIQETSFVEPVYKKPGICPDVQEIIEMLDGEYMQKALLSLADSNWSSPGTNKKRFLAYPICRYADESTMTKLTKQVPKWSSLPSGRITSLLDTFLKANMYSETRAAMKFADKFHVLSDYARIRDTTEDEIRDNLLSDVGLDESGRKSYNLGNQTVTAVLQPDFSFLIELYDGKIAKSIPKRGSNEYEYEAAKEDFLMVKKSVKEIAKRRAGILFEDFLDRRSRNANEWKNAYINNPVLRMTAKLLVWAQDNNTFTLSDDGAINAEGKPYTITNSSITLAHPMEMRKEEVTAWQKYFVDNNLKQPFEQIWEPVIDEKFIAADRYRDCNISITHFFWSKKHGIYARKYFDGQVDITIDNCDAKIEHLDYDCFAISKFGFDEYTRRVNHIVAYLDRITIYDRVKKNDVSIVDLLPQFTLAQITEFIKIAQENSCTDVIAILLDYKNNNFAAFNPIDEFSLEW